MRQRQVHVAPRDVWVPVLAGQRGSEGAAVLPAELHIEPLLSCATVSFAPSSNTPPSGRPLPLFPRVTRAPLCTTAAPGAFATQQELCIARQVIIETGALGRRTHCV